MCPLTSLQSLVRFSPKKRVLVVDDHILVADGLVRILSADYDVVGISPTGRALLEDIERLPADVVCLDIGMPDMNGIEVAERLLKVSPRTKVIFVTQHVDLQYLRAAFRAGAKGYVAKQSATSELLNAIQKVLAGGIYVTPILVEAAPNQVHELIHHPAKFFTRTLTPRQREVLQLVAEGKTNREISEKLNISQKTVEFHKNGLMNELGLHTTADLTRYALNNHVIVPN